MIQNIQNTELKHFIRYCTICNKKLTIAVNSDNIYKGGHFFGKLAVGNKKKAEYWECNKCHHN